MPTLDQKVTRNEAVGALIDEVLGEADFTEQNDPDHDHGNEGTYGDYIADLIRRLTALMEG